MEIDFKFLCAVHSDSSTGVSSKFYFVNVYRCSLQRRRHQTRIRLGRLAVTAVTVNFGSLSTSSSSSATVEPVLRIRVRVLTSFARSNFLPLSSSAMDTLTRAYPGNLLLC